MENDNNKEKRYKAYESIKFMSDRAYSKMFLNQKAYLILSKSMTKFLKIIHDLNGLSPNRNITNNELIYQIEEKLADYESEQNIQIFYKEEQFKSIINSEDNEFVIVDEKFLKSMDIDLSENADKMVTLIKKENIIEVKLKNDRERFILEPKNNGLFKIREKVNIVNIEPIPIINNNNNNVETTEKNNINLNSISNIVCLFDCWLNISKIKKYFIENKNIFISNNSNKVYSKLFFDYLNNNNNFDQQFLIINKFVKERKYLNDIIKNIEIFYNKMNSELNEKKNNSVETKHYENKDLKEVAIKIRKDFENKNKSIFADLFYFDKITIMKCEKCKNEVNKINFIDKLDFDLEEVRKYKVGKCDFFESLNTIDCLKCMVANNVINKTLCKNCNTENLASISRINTPPEILSITLNYGSEFKSELIFDLFPEKDSDNLSINIDFCIFNWSQEDKNKNKNIAIYNLIGFCSYYDNNEGKYCRSFYLKENNKWYLHRNKEIIEVSLKERDKGKPYLLLYQKINKFY